MTIDSEHDLREGCRLLSRAARLVQRRQDEALAPLGLTRAALIALEGLAAGALNQEQLAAAVHAKSQTMGKVLARLQIAGLVSRTRHPRDRRQLIIGLTSTGRAALEAARQTEALAFPPDQEGQGWMTLREELARFVMTLQNQERNGQSSITEAGNRPAGPGVELPRGHTPNPQLQPAARSRPQGI